MITDNEKQARDIVRSWLEGTLPTLTDEECRSIAANYPYPYGFIRATFPSKEKTVSVLIDVGDLKSQLRDIMLEQMEKMTEMLR